MVHNDAMSNNLDEQDIERRVVNWLGVLAVVAILGVVILELIGRTSEASLTIALIGIASAAASSLGTRRTRIEPRPVDMATVKRGDAEVTVPAYQFDNPLARAFEKMSDRQTSPDPQAGSPFATEADSDFMGH